MTNFEMIKTMPVGSQWIFAPNIDGNELVIVVRRHSTGFQIQNMGDDSDSSLTYKWLQEESEE